MPEVTHRDQQTIDIAATQGGQIMPVPKKQQIPVQQDDNSLPALFLFVPLLFLLAIAALLLERAIKWGFRRFFAPTPAAHRKADLGEIAPSYRQIVLLK